MAYALLPHGEQRRTTPARFAVGRLARFGLLGLLDHDPAGGAWGCRTVEPFCRRRNYPPVKEALVAGLGEEEGS